MFEQFNILDFVADDNTDSISSTFYIFEDVRSYYCYIHRVICNWNLHFLEIFITLFKCNAGVVVMPFYNDEFHYVVFVIIFYP